MTTKYGFTTAAVRCRPLASHEREGQRGVKHIIIGCQLRDRKLADRNFDFGLPVGENTLQALAHIDADGARDGAFQELLQQHAVRLVRNFVEPDIGQSDFLSRIGRLARYSQPHHIASSTDALIAYFHREPATQPDLDADPALGYRDGG